MKAAEKFDERIGVCVDVGHTARMKVDPAEAIRKCAPRLYDVHLKDLANLDRPNNGVEMGRGVLDVRAMLQALLDIKFAYHAGIEYEDCRPRTRCRASPSRSATSVACIVRAFEPLARRCRVPDI